MRQWIARHERSLSQDLPLPWACPESPDDDAGGMASPFMQRDAPSLDETLMKTLSCAVEEAAKLPAIDFTCPIRESPSEQASMAPGDGE